MPVINHFNFKGIIKMKLLRYIISPGVRSLASSHWKTFLTDSSLQLHVAKKSFSNILVPSPALYLSVKKLHTTCLTRQTTEKQGLSSPTKKRLLKKKTQKFKDNVNRQTSSAVAYSTAERYKMQDLITGLEYQGLYQHLPLPEDVRDNLHINIKNGSTAPSSHIYIFSEGNVVFWDIPEEKIKEMLNFLKSYEINPYEEDLVEAEKEDLDYVYVEEETRLCDGCIKLNSKCNTDLQLYAFSNSLAQSVKLGILEAVLENFTESIGWVTETMKKGEKLKMSRAEIFAKRGELFSIRHAINLSSDLLDTPDFYWDRKDLEILYLNTCNYLDVPLRTRTMNVRLNYCSELVDLLVNHMNDEHHVRLEWMIIILIMVEVVFECMHFLERFTH